MVLHLILAYRPDHPEQILMYYNGGVAKQAVVPISKLIFMGSIPITNNILSRLEEISYENT